MSFIRDRVNKAKKIEAEIKRLKSLQTKRTKAVGESSESITQQIKVLANARKALPPKRDSQAIGNDVAFWAGGTLSGAIYTMMNPNNLNPPAGQEQANFVVTHGGTVIANQAIIRGNIFAEDGVFSGTVYASDGVFSGTVYASEGEFNGKITSNSDSGDKIVIDPAKCNMEFIESSGDVSVAIGKNITHANPSTPFSSVVVGTPLYGTQMHQGGIDVFRDSSYRTAYLKPSGIGFRYENENTNTPLTSLEANVWANQDGNRVLLIQLRNLPTSKDGLPSGALYRNGNSIEIV